MSWADVIYKELEGLGGEASLPDIYKAFENSESGKFLIATARSRTRKDVDVHASIRCVIQRDARFERGCEKGRWRTVRKGAIERLKVGSGAVKLRGFRMRKESAILKFFELQEYGTTEQILYFINKKLVNCHGRPIRHGSMSARECGQILKRLHFIKQGRVWIIPKEVEVVA